jgi:hypothetical protein
MQFNKKEKISLALILVGAVLMIAANLVVNKYQLGQNMPLVILIIGGFVFYAGAILLSGAVEVLNEGSIARS